jgi:hypothetical protein
VILTARRGRRCSLFLHHAGTPERRHVLHPSRGQPRDLVCPSRSTVQPLSASCADV